MGWFSGARARVALLLKGKASEARFQEEIALHIDLETDRLVREENLPRDEASRRARAGFGGVTQHTETLRRGRGLAWWDGLSLDFTLGGRMLLKYPGLTLVGGLAMAFSIWTGSVTFELVSMMLSPSLPIPGSERIVEIEQFSNQTANDVPARPYDYLAWRGMTTLADIGAYRDVGRNLITRDGDSRPVNAAEVSAAAFRIMPDVPFLGRALTAEDERVESPAVVVLGYDIWRIRFGADSGIVGSPVQLGDTYATIVGVMPKGYAFPVAHELWTPLKVDALDRAAGAGPQLTVFGRLAPAATMEAAQAEATTIGKRVAATTPQTHEHFLPKLKEYANIFGSVNSTDQKLMMSIPVFGAMLLVLVCGNVALLLFARSATRERELVVRAALGASRARIVAQLFVEALVLGGLAATVGIFGAKLALETLAVTFLKLNYGAALPFWLTPSLSPATILYAIALTALAAVVVGVLPALRITRGLGQGLRQGTAGSGMRFGGIWTAVIVAQVAVTVAFPAAVFVTQSELRRIRDTNPGFKSAEYLALKFDMEDRARYARSLDLLRQRITAEPGVAGVSFINHLPLSEGGFPWRYIEMDGVQLRRPDDAGQQTAWTNVARIDPEYFSVLEAPMLAGRAFTPADQRPDAGVAIVDEVFVQQYMPGRNVVGHRVRFVDKSPRKPGEPEPVPEPWLEIVGVAKGLGMKGGVEQSPPIGLYVPAVLTSNVPFHMVVHSRGDPVALVAKVRTLATSVDPTLRMVQVQRMNEVTAGIVWILGFWLRSTAFLSGIAVMLSLAGIYAVLSFTVSRRTREIGVRAALGAGRQRIIMEILRRPVTQVAIGVVLGVGIIGGLASLIEETQLPTVSLIALVGYALFMLGVCLTACVLPTWRALRVQPTEALRAE
jgi:putative ABC transport system permease protein